MSIVRIVLITLHGIRVPEEILTANGRIEKATAHEIKKGRVTKRR
jgi:hypothetical protein